MAVHLPSSTRRDRTARPTLSSLVRQGLRRIHRRRPRRRIQHARSATAGAQLLSKVVHGFRKDLLDAEQFVQSGMVDSVRFRELVRDVPDTTYARYPNLSRDAVLAAVEGFLSDMD